MWIRARLRNGNFQARSKVPSVSTEVASDAPIDGPIRLPPPRQRDIGLHGERQQKHPHINEHERAIVSFGHAERRDLQLAQARERPMFAPLRDAQMSSRRCASSSTSRGTRGCNSKKSSSNGNQNRCILHEESRE